MAILPGVSGVEVRIFSNKRPMIEYDDPDGESEDDEDATETTKFIESNPGAHFWIDLLLNKEWRPEYETDLVARIYVDGINVCEEFIKKGQLPQKREVKGAFFSKKTQNNFREFRFANLEKDQEEHHLRNPNRVLAVKSIGSIRMEIFRSHLCKKSRAFGKTKQVRSLNHLKINEKERKGEAVSLRSDFDRNIRNGPRPALWTGVAVDPADKPLGVFRFLYRSEDDLMAMHVIPRRLESTTIERRSREQSLGPASRFEKLESDPEFRLLLQRVLQRIDSEPPNAIINRRVKRERSANYNDPIVIDDEELTYIETRPANKRMLGSSVEIIDLTVDSDDEDEEPLFVPQ